MLQTIGISGMLIIHFVIGLACWLYTSRAVLGEYKNITPKFRRTVIAISFLCSLVWELLVICKIVEMAVKFFFYPESREK